jgi:hypothetical protein
VPDRLIEARTDFRKITPRRLRCEIVVTRLNPRRPAVLSICAATPGKTLRRRTALVAPDLGKVRNDAIRRVLLAPLPGECKGCHRRSFKTLPGRKTHPSGPIQ